MTILKTTPLSLVLLLTFVLNNIHGQEHFFNRYTVAYPEGKNINFLTIHDNLLNKDSIYKINADFLDFSKFRQAQYINNQLYVLFHFGNKPEEIWQLTNNSSKIFLSGRAISSFEISPDNRLIALSDSIVRICKMNGKTISKITSICPLDAMVEVYGWSSDNDLVWFYRTGPNCYVDSIYSYRVSKKELLRYPIPKDFCEFSINTDKSLILYSDFPDFCSDDDNITKGNPKSLYYLFLDDLTTGSKKLLKQNIGKSFTPQWIDKDTYEYFDKKSNKIVRVKI